MNEINVKYLLLYTISIIVFAVTYITLPDRSIFDGYLPYIPWFLLAIVLFIKRIKEGSN